MALKKLENLLLRNIMLQAFLTPTNYWKDINYNFIFIIINKQLLKKLIDEIYDWMAILTDLKNTSSNLILVIN